MIIAACRAHGPAGKTRKGDKLAVFDVPGHSALFLDLDGTLIDIAPTPDAVTTPDGLVATLAALTEKLGGALAILTGRPIADVDWMLHPLRPMAAGVHGAEIRWTTGGAVERRAEAIDADVVAAVKRVVDDEPGAELELKHVSVAVHYRSAPDAGSRLQSALRDVLEDGPDHLMLAAGRRVLEIVPRNVAKGKALEAFMTLPAFRSRTPVMIGDDVTDETAFAAAGRLGGLGLKVAGEHFQVTDAHFAGPEHVRRWLADYTRRTAS